MAYPTPELIQALRTTAQRLRDTNVQYYWSHQGSCNCGHLAQTITHLSKAEIHSCAIERHGDWDDHAEDYCPTSGHKLDYIITEMLSIGLERSDIGELERLSNTQILRRIPAQHRALQYNRREDVILYMETWATMLEEQLLDEASEALSRELQILCSSAVPIEEPLFSERQSLVAAV
ncbi:MAG: hypothetical protein RML40_08455 [Bacteroidota bacterium]|nr:hypothetical protein [Candidatus Kapabacteria bacterium]MDW8220547.1 hypothetical protein [Bacteroidota bacterium]